MIVMKVRLRSANGRQNDRQLAKVKIWNDGTGTATVGNYQYTLSHSGDYYGRKGVYKKGRVTGYNRRWSVYRLIGMVLKHAGEA